MKIVCIIQARMASTRLYGKVMLPLGDKPVVQFMHDRVQRQCKCLNSVLIATTNLESDDHLCGFLHRANIQYFRGSSSNVLKRYYDAASFHNADVVVRLTADCPLIDTQMINAMVQEFKRKPTSYLTNRTPPTYPDGFDVEIFTFEILEQAYKNARSEYETEHVTPYFYTDRNDFSNFASEADLSHIRLTLDDLEDYQLISKIVENIDNGTDFKANDVLKIYSELCKDTSASDRRDIGAKLNPGAKLWQRALEIIPNGNMLLSKNADQHLPKNWPAYFERAKGVNVYDMSGNKLIDCHLMGVGTNLLGYGNVEVDRSVLSVVQRGNLSTLNAPEEVWLAEELLRLDSWADQVKFTRTGGEASAVATRLGRAASGKDAIAVCGYHGWHDWYLSANLRSTKGLSEHLLPGLSTTGIPKALSDTTYSFSYNDIESLTKLVNDHSIGVIQMEVMRNYAPKNNFLEKVRALCDERGIVLVFDECSSGFRETSSGLYKKFNVIPDIVIYGKALGNGYAVNAIVGKRAVMSEATNSFISSTFWTERIGSAAALKTLEVMQRERAWEICTDLGKKLQNNWYLLAKKHQLEIEITGLPALSSFTFSHNDHLKYKTYITQEMLKVGILASNVFYVSLAHEDRHFDVYFEKLDDIFYKLSLSMKHGGIDELLENEVCSSGFGRLN